MVFSSFNFLFLFLPALLLLYFLIPPCLREGRNFVLLTFSLVFYACGGPPFLLLMLASIAINYISGLLVRPQHKHRRCAVFFSVILNLGLLGWFKYAGFFLGTLATLGVPCVVPDIVLPIGISFFTFQGMSYVLDVYRGDATAERNPFRVALYIALFPQLVAGPIVRYTTVAEEIAGRKETLSEFAEGGVRFLFGLSKKLVIANGVGAVADAIFAMTDPTVSLAWIGAIAYTAQIYFDFSGYSDMAIGLGRMFGFHFLENFNYPYIAHSLTDFWRRWHISLSTWFRDYLYIPLGGNRCGLPRQIFNLLVVWCLTGFWHGAAWTFLLWGLYYAILLIGERYLWGKLLKALPRLFQHIYALFFIVLGWVLFRSETFPVAAQMFRALFGGAPIFDERTTYYCLEYGWVLLLAVVASLPWKNWLQHSLERRNHPLGNAVALWMPRILALALFCVCYIQLLSSTFNPFIYFRF